MSLDCPKTEPGYPGPENVRKYAIVLGDIGLNRTQRIFKIRKTTNFVVFRVQTRIPEDYRIFGFKIWHVEIWAQKNHQFSKKYNLVKKKIFTTFFLKSCRILLKNFQNHWNFLKNFWNCRKCFKKLTNCCKISWFYLKNLIILIISEISKFFPPKIDIKFCFFNKNEHIWLFLFFLKVYNKI